MKTILKGSLFALIAGLAASQAAAADIAYAQPAPAPSLIGSDPIRTDEFSGFFVGGQAGVAIGNIKGGRQTTTQIDTLSGTGLPFTPVVGASTTGSASRFKQESGFGVNGIVGYDVNFGGIVIGAAATVGYDDVRNRFDTVFANAAAANNGFGGTAVYSGRFQSNYNVGARLRAGYVVLPQMLLYAFTGIGIQGGEYKFGVPGSSISRDAIVPTWSVGAGVEYALGGGWSVTGEYGYTRGFSHTVSSPFAFSQGVVAPGITLESSGLASVKAETETHRVMAGVNYRFR